MSPFNLFWIQLVPFELISEMDINQMKMVMIVNKQITNVLE